MQDARSFSFKSVGKRSVGCVFHTGLLFCGKGCDLYGRKNVRGFSCPGAQGAGPDKAELAEQLHVTDKAVSRWERGVGLPDINTLEPLADALGLSLADLMHCHDPGQGAPSAPVPLEDFFSMLRRRPVADWHSVRTALLRLSIALALWGIFACHGTLAVHWRSLSDGSLQADGWMSSWVVFPLLAGMEFLMLELWNSFEQSGFYHRYLEACTLLDTPFLRLTRVILELLLFFGFGFLVPCAEITIMLFN